MHVAVEVLEGVGPSAAEEVAERFGPEAVARRAPTELGLELPDDRWREVEQLRCAVAAHLVVPLPGPRPRSFTSPDQLKLLTDAVAAVGRRRFEGLRIGAAGSDSPEMVRLAEVLAVATGLRHDPDEGDLLIRLRRADRGWQALVRTTPRPLSARAWRTERYAAGLNATIAAAMVRESRPHPDDRVLDPMCGSGTLLVERLAAGPAALAEGSDISAEALRATEAHLRAARIKGARVQLRQRDVRELQGSFTSVLVNPPWGTNSGSHEGNEELYPALLEHTARVTTDDARMVVLTHDVRRFEAAVDAQRRWRVHRVVRVFQKGHHPRLFRLVRIP